MDHVVVLGISSGRHSCKVCGKGFPCGRSLGGHMRSHSLAEVAMADDVDASDDYQAASSPGGAYNNGVLDSGSGGGGYGLRENPKKTHRLDGDGGRAELFYADDDGKHDAVLADADPCEDDVEMLIPTEATILMPAPRRRRRSMRVPALAPPPASSASFDKEPEDVALCLIMLSRNTPSRWASPPPATDGKKKRRNATAYYHDADSDDTASAFFHYDDDVDEVTAKTIKKKRKPAACYLASGDETNNKRGGRYECPGCGRAFQSYQALGGHRASHKRINSNCSITKVVALDQPEPSVETNNTSFSTASTPASPEVDRAARKMSSSKFECPICFKVFASGQALGGHKRSHSIAGELYERANNTTGIVEPEHALVAARFLDLNLPAPGAED